MIYPEEDFLLLSGLQHFKFCRRQWALIHVEQQWAENFRTVDGALMHSKAHEKGSTERRGDLLIVRSLPVFSASLGVSGECDVVEFHETTNGITLKGQSGLWQPYPVEYKRGSTASRPGTFFSFADRPCAWRRCSAARFLKGRCITGRPAAVSGFPFRKSFGGRFAPAIRCPFRLVLPRTGTAS